MKKRSLIDTNIKCTKLEIKRERKKMIKKLYYSTAYKEEEDFINKQKDHLKNFKKIVETLKSYKIQEHI